ncbi:MAG: FkbM family methyltransferase [Bacteroidetes bacterium]|nr:FkbM family methyltransferase [Bacteroidota bacterium]
MSFSIKLGNFLYKNAFGLYKPMYKAFKNKQDAFEIDLLKKHIQKNDTVLDIGANIGFYATILSHIVGGNGTVHCFEPDTKNFEHLKKATANFKNIKINNKAVGPKTEKLKIYTSKNLNVDHRTYKPEEYDQEIEIDAVSIDDHLSSATKVDFIKMDIQGFEMQAIQGMQTILEKNKDVKLISEFWPYGLRKAGSSVNDYFNFLVSKGFNCYLLEENSLLKLTAEKVRSLEPLGEEHYFNIFATRNNV